MVDQNQEPITGRSTEEQQLQHAIMDTTNHLLYHAPCTTPFCCCCCSSFCSNSSSMKRRSPSSSATEQRACKKLFRENQLGLTLNGITPEHANAVASASYLSPLPQSVKGFVCDPTPTPSPATATTFFPPSNWGDNGVILTNEEASNSMRLRRMKDCLREMRKWWDEVMREEEEEEDDTQNAEGDKVLHKEDDCGGDAEEAVRIEWADQCLSICFKCPCSKGYQILLSGNNCYYKLV